MWETTVVAGFLIPAAAVWTCMALFLNVATRGAPVLPVALLYAVAFGVCEAAQLNIRTPESRWQVPASWIRNRAQVTQIAVWGAILGPGLATRNPFASMWLWPMLLAIPRTPVSAAAAGLVIGSLHGSARAIGILHNIRCADACSDPLALVTQHMRWRLIDGAALLLASGVMVAVVLGAV